MRQRYVIFLLVLVLFISLGILGNIYLSLIHNHSYLGFLHTSPKEIVVENHYYYSLEEINDFKDNYSIYFLYFPIGRLIPNKSVVNTYLNSEKVVLPIVNDGVGGSWINVSFELFTEDLNITLSFIHRKSTIKTFKDPKPNATKWTEPSVFIDSDNTELIGVAQNITEKDDTYVKKARSIFDFVKDLLDYKYPSYAPEWASQILFSKYGQCIQYSNLFVGLCRAIQIPSRTVFGYVSTDPFFKIPHQWAEFMDEEGYWHQVDASNENRTRFDFTDPLYFDFYYAEHQNPFDPAQTYFPSISYQVGELSVKSVTLDLVNNLELCLNVVGDYRFVLWFCFIVCVFIITDRVNRKRKERNVV